VRKPGRDKPNHDVTWTREAGRPLENGSDTVPQDEAIEPVDVPVESAPEGVEPSAAPAAAPAKPGAPVPESAEDYKDRWLRGAAEFQNYRRRTQREAEDARRNGEERVMLEMIAAIDDLERAIESAAQGGAPSSWTEGVRLTAQRLRDYLGRQGVRVVEPLGEPFDPAFHEAMLQVDPPAGSKPGDVVQVVTRGYARGDRALRPARVVVARSEKL
jgi:molecular chaperone GrpE